MFILRGNRSFARRTGKNWLYDDCGDGGGGGTHVLDGKPQSAVGTQEKIQN